VIQSWESVIFSELGVGLGLLDYLLSRELNLSSKSDSFQSMIEYFIKKFGEEELSWSQQIWKMSRSSF